MTGNTKTTDTESATHLSEQMGFWAGVAVLFMAGAVLLALGPSVAADSEYRHLLETLIGIAIVVLALGAGQSFRRAAGLADAGWATFFTWVAWIAFAFMGIVIVSTCNSWSAAEPMVPWPFDAIFGGESAG